MTLFKRTMEAVADAHTDWVRPKTEVVTAAGRVLGNLESDEEHDETDSSDEHVDFKSEQCDILTWLLKHARMYRLRRSSHTSVVWRNASM